VFNKGTVALKRDGRVSKKYKIKYFPTGFLIFGKSIFLNDITKATIRGKTRRTDTCKAIILKKKKIAKTTSILRI